jgi:hypothetical protein
VEQGEALCRGRIICKPTQTKKAMEYKKPLACQEKKNISKNAYKKIEIQYAK